MAKHVLLAAAAVLLVAGCGGTAGKRAAPPPTRAEFAARASKVCREARTPADRLDGLRRLRPPPAAADLFSHWLAAEREALAAAKELAHPTVEPVGDPRVPLTIAGGKITGYARRLGAHACEEPQAGTLQP